MTSSVGLKNSGPGVTADCEIGPLVSRYLAGIGYIYGITARPRQLSVTESVALPPQPRRRSGVKSNQIRFRWV